MIRDNRDIELAGGADVLIIGAGAVGITAGLLLHEAGYKVAVIEAGSRQPSADFQGQNAGPTTGFRHDGIRDGRVRALGGTTRLWGGQLVRFSQEDFDVGFHGATWPIRFADVDPWYDSALSMVAPDFPAMPDGNAAIGMNSPRRLGPHLEVGQHVWLRQPDFSKLFGDRLADLKGLDIYLDTEVRDLIFSPSGDVTGVVASVGPYASHVIPAKAVILANGTLEINRIMLSVAKNNVLCPFSKNKNIGRYFFDHLHGIVGTINQPDKRKLRKYWDSTFLSGYKFSTKVRLSTPTAFGGRRANCAATVNSEATFRSILSDGKALLRQLFSFNSFASFLASIVGGVRILRLLSPAILRYMATGRSDGLLGTTAKIGIEIEQIPTEKSYLFLDPDDHSDFPKIGIHWDFDGAEYDSAIAFCTVLEEELVKNGVGRPDFTGAFLDRSHFFSILHDANHHMGGCRMAEDASNGVVDSNLRVFGTENLYVLGAAIFPSGSFANPTFTALAFAHRLVDHLKSRIGRVH